MKRFKVTITDPAGEPEHYYYWDSAQVHNFTGMPEIDVIHILHMEVKFDDGSGFTVEEDK